MTPCSRDARSQLHVEDWKPSPGRCSTKVLLLLPPSPTASVGLLCPRVQNDVVPSIIPGLVLGGLALIGFLMFVAWVRVQCSS